MNFLKVYILRSGGVYMNTIRKRISLYAGRIVCLGVVLSFFYQILFVGCLTADDRTTGAETPGQPDVIHFRIQPSPPPEPPSQPLQPSESQSQPKSEVLPTHSPEPSSAPLINSAAPPSDTVEKSPPPPAALPTKKPVKKRPVKPVHKPVHKIVPKPAHKQGTQNRSKNEAPPAPTLNNASESVSRKIIEIREENLPPHAEKIMIELNGYYPPETQVLEGDTPKIVCDFQNVRMEKSIKRLIPVNGEYVLQIRTGIHPPPAPKSRVVVDLVAGHNYNVEQLFYENENIYSLIIREKSSNDNPVENRN